MNGESDTNAQLEPGLVERISALEPGSKETQSEFLGRAAILACEFEDHVLNHSELNYVRELLPGWDFSPGKLRSIKFIRATRLGSATAEQEEVLPAYNNDRRVVAQDKRSNNIVVLAKSVLKGSDVACILAIEAASRNNQSQAKPPPKASDARRNVNGHSLEVPKLDEATGLMLSETERETVSLLGFSLDEMSSKLEVDKSAASKRVTFAIERNNITRKELLDRAVKGKLINLDPLPLRRDYTLTEIELAFLKDYVFENRAEAAKGLNLETADEVSNIRKSIAKKFGLVKNTSSTHIYIIAKRDGLV